MSKQIRNAKSLQSKSRTNSVEALGGNRYEVTSGKSGKVYTVRTGSHGATCTCKWGQYRPAMDQRSGCSHVQAVYNHINQGERGRNAYAWNNEADAQRQKRHTLDIGDGVLITC